MELFSYVLSQTVSLLVYRKATDFRKLILYPAGLLKLFMESSIFGEVLGFFRYKIMSSGNRVV
jgi:hypothetical protein